MGPESGNLDEEAAVPFTRRGPRLRGDDGLMLKWPNDLLVGTAKFGGILLERIEGAVTVGIGVNLAHHPDGTSGRATSLAAEGLLPSPPDILLIDLAQCFARALAGWRASLDATRAAWLAAAHPIGTPLSTHDADGTMLTGTFDGLDASGACRLRLAGGGVRLIHAGDLFLV